MNKQLYIYVLAAFVADCSLVGFTIKNIDEKDYIQFKSARSHIDKQTKRDKILKPGEQAESEPDWGKEIAKGGHKQGWHKTKDYQLWVPQGSSQLGLNAMDILPMSNQEGAQLLMNPATICYTYYDPNIKKVLFRLVAPDGKELIVSPEILEERKRKQVAGGIAESPLSAGDVKSGEEKKKQAESPRAKPISGAPGGPAFPDEDDNIYDT